MARSATYPPSVQPGLPQEWALPNGCVLPVSVREAGWRVADNGLRPLRTGGINGKDGTGRRRAATA